MRDKSQRRRRIAGAGVASIAALGGLIASTGIGAAGSPVTPGTLTPVAAANTKATGFARSDVLSASSRRHQSGRAPTRSRTGPRSTRSTATTATARIVPAPGRRPSRRSRRRGEQDRAGQEHLPRPRAASTGADRSYDYGTHFLFQGHETGHARRYITRVNLDADAAHRVTLLADDGRRTATRCRDSTARPGTRGRSRLLFTAENGTSGGVWQATLDYPSSGRGHLGRARPRRLRGHPERLATATSGSSRTSAARTGAINKHAKQPNSFIYRLRPDGPRTT